MDTSVDTLPANGTPISDTGSSFVNCRKNMVDIMEHGNQLRYELQSIRQEFLGHINKNETKTRQPSLTPSNSAILNLLKNASQKLQGTPVAPSAPTLDVKSIAGSETPTLRRRTGFCAFGTNNSDFTNVECKPTKRFFNSPILEKTPKTGVVDVNKLTSIKRKHLFSSPVLNKLPRLDSCLSCDNTVLMESKNNLPNPVSTPKLKKSSRRSSLQKLLSPMRRRSGPLDKAGKASSIIPKMPGKPRLSIITNGLLFNRNQVDAVDEVPKRSANWPRIHTVDLFRAQSHRTKAPVGSSEAKDESTQMSLGFSVNETVKTAELSSDVYSTTPCSTMNQVTVSPSSHASNSLHEHSVITDVIHKVTCNFLTPLEESRESKRAKRARNNRRRSSVAPQAYNRINVSDLMSSMDDGSVLQDSRADTIITDKNIADFSTIKAANTTNMTLREQASFSDMMSTNILHSTFDYPLHSTMYNPLQCTIANIKKSHGEESIDISNDSLDLSANNNSSDCDSSVLSIDVDKTSIDVPTGSNNGNCYVCKVSQLRREMAQPRLESRRRRAPVGLSQTDIDMESKLPRERPPPEGASQSTIEADQTLVNPDESQNETLSATVGSIPNFTALTELDGTLKAGSSAHKLFTNGSNCCRNFSIQLEQKNQKSKSRRKSSRYNVHDKENQYRPKVKIGSKSHSGKMAEMSDECYSDFSQTPSSLSYMSTSQKKELKRKFKSFNSTVNSSQHTTLAFF